jgi:cyclopropane fatty-acyl-phospholipid synthase-like methyltransferase
MPEEDSAADGYRSFVGPADQYDLIGAAQFALLYALGLRAHHRLLDIGCGSRRAGRMLIAYLESCRYVGVEPEQWLIDQAIEHEIGHGMIAIKQPRFDHSSDFSLDHLGHFDFVLAQGVATNTGPVLLPALLAAIKQTLEPDGLATVTVIHPDSGDTDALPVAIDNQSSPAWRYPGCYRYERAEIAEVVSAAGLAGEPIAWHHPRHTWWLLAHHADGLPPAAYRDQLTGPTLAGTMATN